MGKVKILANGDIVPCDDGDAPVQATASRQPTYGSAQPQRINTGPRRNNQQGAQPSMFEMANQKIVELGVPPLTLGSFHFEPIWLVLGIVSIFLFGVPAFLLVGVFYLIRRSENQPAAPHGNTPGRNAGGTQGGRTLGR